MQITQAVGLTGLPCFVRRTRSPQLLTARGAVVVCQLCAALDAERIYRTFAQVLENEEVRAPAGSD